MTINNINRKSLSLAILRAWQPCSITFIAKHRFQRL